MAIRWAIYAAGQASKIITMLFGKASLIRQFCANSQFFWHLVFQNKCDLFKVLLN